MSEPIIHGGTAAQMADSGVALVVTSGVDGPHVTESSFEWDGTEFRIEGVSWSARSENLRRSPRVALVIRRSADAPLLVVYGDATLHEVTGDSERVMISVRPTRTHTLSPAGR